MYITPWILECEINQSRARSQAYTAVLLRLSLFWDVTYRRFAVWYQLPNCAA